MMDAMQEALKRKKDKLAVTISIGAPDAQEEAAESPAQEKAEADEKTSDLAPPSKMHQSELKNDGDSTTDSMGNEAPDSAEQVADHPGENPPISEITLEEAMKGMPVLEDSEYVRIKAKPKKSLGEAASLRAYEMMKDQKKA